MFDKLCKAGCVLVLAMPQGVEAQEYFYTDNDQQIANDNRYYLDQRNRYSDRYQYPQDYYAQDGRYYPSPDQHMMEARDRHNINIDDLYMHNW